MSPTVKIILGIETLSMVAYGLVVWGEGQSIKLAAAQLLLAAVTVLVYS